MCFIVVCTLIDNDMRHHSGQNVVDSLAPRESTTVLTTVMISIVIDKSTEQAKPHSKKRSHKRFISTTPIC